MKKFVLTFVFSLLMLFVPQESFSQKIDEVHVGFTVDIGRNSTGNCSRFGLCTQRTKVTIKIKIKDLSRKMPEVQNALNREGLNEKQFNTLPYYDGSVLFYYLDEINVNAIKRYTSSDKFIVEEDYNLTDENVGVRNYKISKGEYEYVYDKEKDLYYLKF